ncbi:MAG: hypothetical protein J6Y78_09580 [Paludibacteraceae bacterium]|nr:hypothetical protein [Paludibacteraceae bacterium]
MGIGIRRNGNKYTYGAVYTKLDGSEQIKTPYSLTYYSDRAYYVPLVPAETTIQVGSIIKHSTTYYRCTSDSTLKGYIQVQVNGNTYHAIDMAAFSQNSYAIPAGTYTPSVFRAMILSFIARGSGTTRAVDRATSVTVNNQTVSLSSGALIRYQYQGTSPFNLDFVTFGRSLGTNEYWNHI